MDIKPSLLASFQALLPTSSDPAELAKVYAQGRIFTAIIEQVVQKPQSNNLSPLFEILINAEGKKITAESNQPFSPGQLIKVEVTKDGSLRVLQIVQPATEKQQELIQQGLRQALPLQQNHSTLLNRLEPLQALITQLNQKTNNPVLQQVQKQIGELISSLPRQEQLHNTQQLKQAITQNGSFLEAKLQRILQQLSPAPVQPAKTATTTQQTKTTVIEETLRQNAGLVKQLEALVGKDLKAQLVKLAAQLAPLAAPAVPAKTDGPAGAPHVLSSTPNAATNPQQSGNLNTAVNVTTNTTINKTVTTTNTTTQTALHITSRAPVNTFSSDSTKANPSATHKLTAATTPSLAADKINYAAKLATGASAYSRQSAPQNPSANSAPTPTPSATITAEAQIINRIIQAASGLSSEQSVNPQSPSQSRIEIPELLINTHTLLLLKRAGIQVSNNQTSMPREAFDLAVSTLLRQIANSIAKIQTNQYKSIVGKHAAPESSSINSWYVEIPVFNEGLFRPIQLQIDEERSADQPKDAKQGRQWKITLGFEFEELGEFFATLTLIENTLSATFWSERPQTLRRIEGELDILKKSLKAKGLEIKQLDCCKGTPSIQKSRLDQQLVDIKT
ncbi:MAG: flagellar hook-length control protein FliK [Pseudomonadales bacterium]|nr:flagellar hook-length control protein FliK [Pseudomonadales bacterium]MCP5302854.1 flagellar hook-length control protein FliK [Pseudomonadales bacterium]